MTIGVAMVVLGIGGRALAQEKTENCHRLWGTAYCCMDDEIVPWNYLWISVEDTQGNRTGKHIQIRLDEGRFDTVLPAGNYMLEVKDVSLDVELNRDVHLDSVIGFERRWFTPMNERYILKDQYAELRKKNGYARMYYEWVKGMAEEGRFEKDVIRRDSTWVGEMGWMADLLPKVKMKEGYVLGGLILGGGSYAMGGDIRLYAYKKGSKETLDPGSGRLKKEVEDVMVRRHIFDMSDMKKLPTFVSEKNHLGKYMNVEFDEEGIWQYFLLVSSYNYTPKFWHSCYNSQYLVFDKESLTEVFPTKGPCGCPDEKNQRRNDQLMEVEATRIRNGVEMTSKTTAVLRYTEWTDWGGLICHTVEVTQKDGRLALNWTAKETLYDYDCGVMF